MTIKGLGMTCLVAVTLFGCQEIIYDQFAHKDKEDSKITKQLFKFFINPNQEKKPFNLPGEKSRPSKTPGGKAAAQIESELGSAGYVVEVAIKDGDRNGTADIIITYRSGNSEASVLTLLMETQKIACAAYAKSMWSGDKLILQAKTRKFQVHLFDCPGPEKTLDFWQTKGGRDELLEISSWSLGELLAKTKGSAPSSPYYEPPQEPQFEPPPFIMVPPQFEPPPRYEPPPQYEPPPSYEPPASEEPEPVYEPEPEPEPEPTYEPEYNNDSEEQ